MVKNFNFVFNANEKFKNLKPLILERLMRYYLCLTTDKKLNRSEWISSSTIAKYFNIDDTQVRKDLAKLSIKGTPRKGFKTKTVIDTIRHALGLDEINNAVIVGAGRLGGAIAEYKGFKNFGLYIVAFFDTDKKKIGKKIAGSPVYHPEKIHKIVAENKVQLGMLVCPEQAAQGSADLLIEAGIKAIWNFSPTNISVPEGVFVRNEHISVGLAELCYYIKSSE